MQVGSVPVNNVNLILLQNVVDICTVTATYLLVGHVVAYTGDYAGLVAEGYWIGDPLVDKNEAVIGWQAAIVTSAICTGGIVGRTHTVGYVLVAMLLSGGIQPLLIHWAWTSRGWMTENSLAGNKVHFRDYGGSGLVHVVGALSGFIGCLTLGRRLLRLREIDEASIGNDSSGVAFAGHLLVFIGLLGLCLPSFEQEHSKVIGKQLPHVLINGLLAASTCSLVVVLMHFVLTGEIFNHWTVMRCVQGTVSGLVTISAGIQDYSHPVAAGLGCFAGGVFFLVSRTIFRSALEDYCNIVAAHLVCGFLGCLLVPLSDLESKLSVIPFLLNVAWQLIGLVVISGLVTIVLAPTFLVLDCCGLLRNRWEFLNHERARAALQRGPPRRPLRRIFSSDADTLYLQPGSTTGTGRRASVSPRFRRYEQELAEAGRNPDESEETNVQTIPEPVSEDTIIQAATDLDNEIPAFTLAGEKIKKMRQVHTLPANIFVSEEDSTDGHVGEARDKKVTQKLETTFHSRSSPEVLGTKLLGYQFLSRNSDSEDGTRKSYFLSDISSARGDCMNFRGEPVTLIDEESYSLRRTTKRMNLHKELDLEKHASYKIDSQDIRVLVEPKIDEDSSASESQDDECAFKKIKEIDNNRKR